jgi:N-hydroxyarylamine O-acetyltransferase
MDINHYLKRIQIDIGTKPDYFFLEKLIDHHLSNIPFENLSVRKRRTIILEENFLYRKILYRDRGGFCYELNGLFNWLLTQLGYDVSIVSAEVHLSSEKNFSPKYDHMALLVHLDNTYIVDVGFGDSFRKPILLNGGRVEDVSGKYQVRPPDSNQNYYIIQKQINNEWQPIYRLNTIPRELIDFNEMCRYNSNSPDSQFTQKTICTKANINGRITLTDDYLITTDKREKTRIPVTSFQNFKACLLKLFNMDYEMI